MKCVTSTNQKRGGNIEVSAKNKVSWPHEPIVGESQRRRVSYDQLSLTQWVQGLMEDATDFLWQTG